VRSFWTLPAGWGGFSHSTSAKTQQVEISAAEGKMTISTLVLEGKGKARAAFKLGDDTVEAALTEEGNRRKITLAREVEITPDKALWVTIRN
jgi:hypothetical protein